MSNARILVVDDEPSVLVCLRMLLSSEFEVTCAGNAEQALQLLESDEFDLVLSDQSMPGMTGDQLLTQVAQRWPETERMLITGYGSLEAFVRALNDASISYYITKPWQNGELLEALRNGVKRGSQRRLALEACKERDEAVRSLDEARKQLKDAGSSDSPQDPESLERLPVASIVDVQFGRRDGVFGLHLRLAFSTYHILAYTITDMKEIEQIMDSFGAKLLEDLLHRRMRIRPAA